MKKYNDNIFEILNWILKKDKKTPETCSGVSTFMLNRWLSMSDGLAASVINATVNRWVSQCNLFRDADLSGKFYHKTLPKNFKRINYIKKPDQKITEEELSGLAYNLEKSHREIKFLNQALEEMK